MDTEIRRITDQIRLLIQEIRAEQPKRLGDRSIWDAEHLLTFDAVLVNWSINGYLRLVGTKEDRNPDLIAIRDEVLDRLIHLTPTDLAKLLIQTGDHQSIVLFLTILLDRDATRKEIERRIAAEKIGKLFLDYLRTQTEGSLDDLARAIFKKTSAWWKKKKLVKRMGRLAYAPFQKLKWTPFKDLPKQHEAALDKK